MPNDEPIAYIPVYLGDWVDLTKLPEGQAKILPDGTMVIKFNDNGNLNLAKFISAGLAGLARGISFNYMYRSSGPAEAPTQKE